MSVVKSRDQQTMRCQSSCTNCWTGDLDRRGFDRRGIVPALSLLLFVMTTATAVAAGIPDVLIVTKGVRTLNHFDRLQMKDGSVLFIKPIWTTEQKLPRPPSRTQFFEVKYSLWDADADAKGRIGIPTRNIEKITLWETMALETVDSLSKAERFEDAQFLLDEIQRFNPDWRTGAYQENMEGKMRGRWLREQKNELMVAQAKTFCQAKPETQQFQNGLAMLTSLSQTAPNTDGLAAAIEDVCLPLASEFYRTQRYPQMRELLGRVLAVAPKSDDALKLQATIDRDVQRLMLEAGAALKNGNGRDATNKALDALQIAPDNTQLRQQVQSILGAYQILKIAAYEEAVALDPFNAQQMLERQLQPMLFDRLVEANESGLRFANGPLVEKSHPIPGFRTLEDGVHAIEYEFSLKRNLRWADGTPLSAADVAGTIHGLRNPKGAAYDPELARLLIDVEVRSPFRFSLLTRQHPFPESLFTFPVVPDSLTVRLPERGDPSSSSPLGSGPFVVADPAGPATALRLVANPEFRAADKGQPYVREIEFPRYQKKGEGHAEEDLLKRRIHMISDPSPMQLVRLQNASQEFQTRPLLSDSVWILAINHRHPLLQKRDVRRAILLAIDREAILKQWFSGGAKQSGHTVVTGPFPPHSNACDPKIKPVKSEPVVARDIMKAVVTEQLPTLTLKYPAADLTIELAMNQIRRDLEAVGFQIRLDPRLPNALINDVAEKHDFELAYWRIDHDNILFNVASLFDPSAAAMNEGGSNIFGYAPQPLTQLFVDLRNEQIGDRIWKLQHRIHQTLATDVAMIPLWRLDSFVVYSRRLHGRTPDGKTVDLPVSSRTVFRRGEEWFLESEK
jgi:ABC-type transport system substrate-binding protein